MRLHRLAPALCGLLLACDPAVPEDPAASGGGGGSDEVLVLGVLAGAKGTESGVIQLRVGGPLGADPRSTAELPIRATLQTASRAATLTGGYEVSNGTFQLEGAGYVITGEDGPLGGLWATYTGPDGDGVLNGLVDDGTLVTWCGSFNGTISRGAWNVLASGDGTAVGVYAPLLGDPGRSTGTVTDSTLNLTTEAGGGATGVIDGPIASGTWQLEALRGDWTGSTDGCPRL